jgi:hypothetical protein
MPCDAEQESASAQRSPNAEDILERKRTYRVVLEDITSGVETADSFAIKFALLTRSPLARMKHAVRLLPATIWSGTSRSKAERVLALIEEAGGRGSVVEPEDAPREAPPKPVRTPESERSCPMCGFPLKDEETRCGFCMTSLRDIKPGISHRESERRTSPIPRKRLILFAACFVAGLALIIFLTR